MILVGAPTDLLGDAKFGLCDFEYKFCEFCEALGPETRRNSKCKYSYCQMNAYQMVPRSV
jgi:hypothetical protein